MRKLLLKGVCYESEFGQIGDSRLEHYTLAMWNKILTETALEVPAIQDLTMWDAIYLLTKHKRPPTLQDSAQELFMPETSLEPYTMLWDDPSAALMLSD